MEKYPILRQAETACHAKLKLSEAEIIASAGIFRYKNNISLGEAMKRTFLLSVACARYALARMIGSNEFDMERNSQ